MKTHRAIRNLILAAIAALCLLMLVEPAFAQCVMCRASLGNNSSFIKSFNIGVLVLLVPPVTIFCAIFVIAIRYRRSG
jgi:hypothetical protein